MHKKRFVSLSASDKESAYGSQNVGTSGKSAERLRTAMFIRCLLAASASSGKFYINLMDLAPSRE